MYDDVGGTIKSFAQVQCWLGIIISVIIGIIMIIVPYDDAFLKIIGLVVLIVGSLLSYTASLFLYGFGQLIENTDLLVKDMHKTRNKHDTEPDKASPLQSFLTVASAKDITVTTKNFMENIKGYSIEELKLILADQKDLYTEDEIKIIQNELNTRLQ